MAREDKEEENVRSDARARPSLGDAGLVKRACALAFLHNFYDIMMGKQSTELECVSVE